MIYFLTLYYVVLTKSPTGLRVIATSCRLEAMEDLAKQGIVTMQLDVTDVNAIRRVRDDVAALTGGRLDILVNNA